MKNLKKLLAVIIAIAMMATMMVPAFAEDEISADAQTCKNLGVLKGEGSGVTSEYLAKETVRLQAAIIFLRLLGKEEEALNFTGWEDNFTDADEVAWTGGKNVLAYLKANPDLGWHGNPDGSFDPNDPVTAQMIYKVLLEVLGYKAKVGDSEDYDFEWNEVLDFAADLGLEKIADVEAVTNDDLAAAIVEALKAEVKEGGKTLIEKLVEDGLVDEDVAIEEGLIADELTATAAQTGAKKITVTFNRALSDAEKAAATFDVKQGLVSYTMTPTWAEDNKSVDLANDYNLFAGEYTVTVGGIEKALTVTVVDEKAAKIELTDEYLQLKDNLTIGFKVYNQFDEAMDTITAANLVISVFNATKGIAITGADDAIVDLLTGNTGGTAFAAKDDNIIVTMSYPAAALSVTKTLVVKDASSVKTLQFGQVQPLEGKVRITTSETGLEIPYTFLDQYGVAVKLSEHSAADADEDIETIDGIKFMTSNKDVVDPDTFRVDSNGKLTFDAGATAGTAIITALVPTTGSSATVTIKVEAAAGLKTFTISHPGKLIAAGDVVTIPYVATDTYGAPIAQKDFNYGIGTGANQVNFVSSNDSIIDDATGIRFTGAKRELQFTTLAAGTVTIYVYVNGALQNSITLDVKAAAVPTRIVGLKDVPLLYQVGASKDIAKGNVKVLDQYNREIALGTYGTDTYTVKVSIDGTDGNIIQLTNSTIDNGTGNVTVAGEAAGSQVIKFELLKGTTAISTYKATFKTVADSDITGYSIDTIPELYGAEANDVNAAHAVAITLLGKDSSGNSIVINQGIIAAITSSNTSIIQANATNRKIWAEKAGSAIVAVWSTSGTKLAEVTVTAKDEAPYVASASFNEASYTVSTTLNLSSEIVLKDQYGVAISDAGGKYFSSDSTIASVNASTGVVTYVADGVVTITYVTSTGLVATTEVVAE